MQELALVHGEEKPSTPRHLFRCRRRSFEIASVVDAVDASAGSSGSPRARAIPISLVVPHLQREQERPRDGAAPRRAARRPARRRLRADRRRRRQPRQDLGDRARALAREPARARDAAAGRARALDRGHPGLAGRPRRSARGHRRRPAAPAGGDARLCGARSSAAPIWPSPAGTSRAAASATGPFTGACCRAARSSSGPALARRARPRDRPDERLLHGAAERHRGQRR